MAEGGGPVREENVEEGIKNGHDRKRDLPALLPLLPLPRPVLDHPIHVGGAAAAAPPLQEVVGPGGGGGVHVAGDGGDGAVEGVQVLEGGGAAAAGARGGACADAVRAGVEDERGELRSGKGAQQGEEVEELERGDQVGAHHLVLSLSSHPASCFFRSSRHAFLQIPALFLIQPGTELKE